MEQKDLEQNMLKKSDILFQMSFSLSVPSVLSVGVLITLMIRVFPHSTRVQQ